MTSFFFPLDPCSLLFKTIKTQRKFIKPFESQFLNKTGLLTIDDDIDEDMQRLKEIQCLAFGLSLW